MATHVALLRGVNVGGVKVPMADLRQLAAALGWGGVSTHLNSGNLLFEADEEPAAAGRRLEGALAERFGREIAVMVRTPPELADVLERHPFRSTAADEKHVHVAFLVEPALPDALERLGALDPEACVIDGREAFLHYPEGLGRSKLTPVRLERAFGTKATLRGIRTVAGLLERC